MRNLFIFLDGVGLGADDPEKNPFARAEMPGLKALLDGRRLLLDSAPLESQRASLLALDACLGVGGLPQSATGQAVLLTGQNVPQKLGYHYGPKPNPEVAEFLTNGNLFNAVRQSGRRAAFLNAYPQRYFEGIDSGRRLYSAIPLAAASAGVPLLTTADLYAGQAIAADFTAQGWRDHLGMSNAPVLEAFQAGQRLAQLAQLVDFAFFEYWLSDYAGHGQDMQIACQLLETIDQVLEGLLEAWDDQDGLVLITSDHGNLEDLSTRRHTANPVPALLIGAPELRRQFSAGLENLTDVAPAILRTLQVSI
jgi:2,3-bisphosphoglycerate-independent phosphoglycerate mutase